MGIRSVLAFLLTFFLAEDCFSQLTGCRRAGSIYHTPPSGLNGWTNPVSETCITGSTNTTPYLHYIQNAPGSPSCVVGVLGLGGTGVLVEYQVLYCPADDLLPLLIIPLVLAGITYAKKYKISPALSKR